MVVPPTPPVAMKTLSGFYNHDTVTPIRIASSNFTLCEWIRRQYSSCSVDGVVESVQTRCFFSVLSGVILFCFKWGTLTLVLNLAAASTFVVRGTRKYVQLRNRLWIFRIWYQIYPKKNWHTKKIM